MFSLHINNTEVALPETFDFGMVLENPMFNRRGNYSYPFNLPYEPNKALFGHIKELSAVEPELPIDFEIKWSDVTKLAGTVSRFKYTGGKIEVTLVGAKSAFYAQLKGKYLDEIDMGTGDYKALTAAQVQLIWANATNYSASEYPAMPDYTLYPYTFAPLYLSPKQFYADDSVSIYAGKTLFEVVNAWDPSTQNFYDSAIENGKVLCMNLYLMHILNKIIDYAGYTIQRNDLEKQGEGFFNAIEIDFKRIYFESWVRLMPEWVAGTEFEYKHTLPHNKVNDFLDDLAQWIGVNVVANDINQTVDLVLTTEFIKDDRIETRLNREILTGKRERETFVPPGITLKYTMDDEEFKTNMETIDPSSVQNSVNTYDDLPTLSELFNGVIYKVNWTNRFYRYTEIQEDPQLFAWKPVGEFAPITRGENPEEREINIKTRLTDVFRTLVHIATGGFDTVEYEIEFPFSTVLFGVDYIDIQNGLTKKTDFGTTFLIYKGVKTVTSPVFPDILYPAASYDKWPIRGSMADGFLSLKLIGNNGIDRNYQALPMSWEINYKRPVSFYIDIPEGAVFNFDFLLKYTFNDMSFFINKIHINFKRKKISSVRLECYYATGGAAVLPQHFLLIDDTYKLLIDEVHKLIID